ncbi:restriction endonuclease [Roseateles paludis]|uniref:Restriction endonuclease n=1 Tax=Roseateles paludis TaxID=3145238 RepID=A0ABV0FZL7_9BURK
MNPADAPDVEFTYCDISAIDNEAGVVVAPKVLMGRDTPSRARQAVRAGDVLFSTVRPGLRAIARVPEVSNPVASTGFCVLRPAEGVDGSLLLQLLRSHDFLQQVLPLQRGVSYPAVRDADVLSQLVPLPPATEQTRIVEKLEELLSDLDASVAELKAAQQKLQHYRQSLLKAAVEGSLTAAWREANPAPEETGADLLARILRERRARWEAQQLAKFEAQGKPPTKGWQSAYPEPVQPDVADLPALPESWTWASLDALIVDGPQNGLYLPKERYAAGVPILRIDDYQIGWHRPRDELRQVTANADEVGTYGLMAGDLVINRVNSMTHLGKSMWVPKELAGVVFESNMMRLRLAAAVEGGFVSLYLGSAIGRARLTAEAKWAVNQASINQQDVRRTPVPIPPPAEQSAVALLLEQQLLASGELLTALEAAQAQSTAQRQNLLRAAFAGQLVPQDPADEPAAELLARIRAERAAAQPAPKKHSRSKRVPA